MRSLSVCTSSRLATSSHGDPGPFAPKCFGDPILHSPQRAIAIPTAFTKPITWSRCCCARYLSSGLSVLPPTAHTKTRGIAVESDPCLPRLSQDVHPGEARAVTAVTTHKRHVKSFIPAALALELIGKLRGFFTEKHDRQESVSHTSLFSISIAARSWESLAEQAEQKLM